jgi:hypothetical protein
MKIILELDEHEAQEFMQLLQRLEELLKIIEDVVAEQKVSQLSKEG